MSSLVRTIQRTINGRGPKCRAPHYFGRGSRLGVHNRKAKDLLAREVRHSVKIVAVPRTLRRSKRSLKWLAARAEKRTQTLKGKSA